MLGYEINTQPWVLTYNLFHHKGVVILVAFAGYWRSIQELQLARTILFGHSGTDRIMDYRLKSPDNFKKTHLGKL